MKALIIGVVVLLAGWLYAADGFAQLFCCGDYEYVDHFGEATMAIHRAQILNPAAGRDLTPVTGLNGEAAQLVYEKYIKSFGPQASAAPVNINIGSSMFGSK